MAGVLNSPQLAATKENMITKCTFVMTIKNYKFFRMQPQNKGPGM